VIAKLYTMRDNVRPAVNFEGGRGRMLGDVPPGGTKKPT
jgi:hypothetical protein